MPDLASLSALAAVAESGSIHTAARRLGITPQALSLRIQSTESRVGAALLARSPRGSQLTATGVLVNQWASAVLDAAAEMDAGLAALRSDRAGHIRVAASLTIAEQLLPRWIVALRGEQEQAGVPALSIDLQATNSEAVNDLVRAGKVDVGFVEGPGRPRGLRSRTVARDRLLVVVAPTHPWTRRRTPLTAAELAGTALVTREEGSGTRQALDVALSDHGTTPPILQLSGTASVKAAIIAGAGAGALSSLAVSDDVALGRLRVVPVTGLALVRQLKAVWIGPKQPPAGAVRALVEIAARVQLGSAEPRSVRG
jgi:DNA-binding transcriptional LysR family regulator